jgi:hypothetical protein
MAHILTCECFHYSTLKLCCICRLEESSRRILQLENVACKFVTILDGAFNQVNFRPTTWYISHVTWCSNNLAVFRPYWVQKESVSPSFLPSTVMFWMWSKHLKGDIQQILECHCHSQLIKKFSPFRKCWKRLSSLLVKWRKWWLHSPTQICLQIEYLRKLTLLNISRKMSRFSWVYYMHFLGPIYYVTRQRPR